MILTNIIENKSLRNIELKEHFNRFDHIFFSIINSKDIFMNDEERILGLMIFNSCQDSINAIRIGNLNLYNHYLDKIDYYSNKIRHSKVDGINAIIYPMKAYKYYFEKSIDNAINEILIAIKSLINISEELGKNALGPIIEQYKNLALIYLTNNNIVACLNIIEFLLNDFIIKDSTSEYLFPIKLKENSLKKHFFNNIIDEILMKQYRINPEGFNIFLQSVTKIMSLSSIYKNESVILSNFLSKKCNQNDIYLVVQSDLPSIVEGNIIRENIEYLNQSEKQIISDYFTKNYNFTL